MSPYYTLLGSLPELSPPDRIRQLPFSRISLEKRLSMLSSEDLTRLKAIEPLLFPAATEAPTDASRVHSWKAVLDQYSQPLSDTLALWLELISFLAALRLRREGSEASAFVGFGRWASQIKQHWQEPYFRLEDRFDHLRQLARLYEKQEVAALERQMNRFLWQQALQLESREPFCFDALAGFWIRWLIAERVIASRDKDLHKHFNLWVEQALTDIESHLPPTSSNLNALSPNESREVNPR